MIATVSFAICKVLNEPLAEQVDFKVSQLVGFSPPVSIEALRSLKPRHTNTVCWMILPLGRVI